MATIKQGALGGFSGKVGPITGSSWKGKAVIKARPLSVNDPNTVLQQQIRAKFKLITQFFSVIYAFIFLGFKKQAVDITEMNAAIKTNFADGFTGTFPTYSLNYSKLLVAKGNVDNPYNPSAQVQGTDLSISWTDNSGIGNALETDKVMFLAYNTVKKQAVVVTDAADRSTRQASYSLPTAWVSDSIEVYLAVRRAEGEDTSTSLYLGSFNL